jgi:branched-chain amino acid transport system substrate-binding protein
MLVLFADGASAQRLASDCKNLGYTVPLIIPSIAVNPSLTADPNLNSFGVYLATYTAPDVANDTPALQAFHNAYKNYAGSSVPDAPGLQAWASGKMLEAAINTLGVSARAAPITTAVILKGLANVKNETLGGLIPPTSYPAGQQPVLSHCYGILQIKNSTFIAPHGSQLFCPAGF